MYFSCANTDAFRAHHYWSSLLDTHVLIPLVCMHTIVSILLIMDLTLVTDPSMPDKSMETDTFIDKA